MKSNKQQKKMKFKIICDDDESLDFITRIISQGCLNCGFNKKELKKRYPTYYPALIFSTKYIKNSEDIENFFDSLIDRTNENNIFKSNEE